MLKQYEKLDKDPLLFVHWMKKQCQANSGHAKKTYDVVKGLNPVEKVIPKGKEASKNSAAVPFVVPKSSQSTLKSSALMPSQSTSYSTGAQCKALVSINKSKVIDLKPTEANDRNDGLNQHLVKLREQFSSMHDTANQKMLELQLELTKMQQMSHEFDILAEFLSSEEKLSSFEQNLDRLQKTVQLTEDKLEGINTNSQKLGQMIRQINETAKIQHNSNEKAINAIGDRLIRWESKLDRVAKRIANQQNGDLKGNGGDYGQLKDDIEGMLNGRLDDISSNMKWMVLSSIIALIIFQTIVFYVIKTDDANVTE